MRFFRLRPPTPGHAVAQPDQRIVFTWTYPSSDPIVTDVLFFGVPEPFAERLRPRDFSGYSLAPTETRSGDTTVRTPVLRLVVDGQAGVDDFGMQTPTTLVVSERVVDEMRAYGMKECTLHDYDPAYRVPTPAELLARLRERGPR
jgi:hypothetical protein